MKTYIGAKIINATPMTLGDYNFSKGWEIPKDEKPDRAGYLIKYSDNYISWSPKEVFELAYREVTQEEVSLVVERKAGE